MDDREPAADRRQSWLRRFRPSTHGYEPDLQSMLLNIARWLLWQIAEPARPITHGPPANITIFDGRARADRSAGAPDGAS